MGRKKNLENLDELCKIYEDDNQIQKEKEEETLDESENEIEETPIELPPPTTAKPKSKRSQRSPKQIETFNRALEIRKQKIAERKENKEKERAEAKAALEEKIVKKAVSIKKKQIKKQAVLDDISDDETPIEEIKEIVKKPRKKKEIEPVPEPPKLKREPPKYLFF